MWTIVLSSSLSVDPWIFHLSPLPGSDDCCLLRPWKIGWEHPPSGRKLRPVKFTPLQPVWESREGLPKKIKIHKKCGLYKERRGQSAVTRVNHLLLSHCINACEWNRAREREQMFRFWLLIFSPNNITFIVLLSAKYMSNPIWYYIPHRPEVVW